VAVQQHMERKSMPYDNQVEIDIFEAYADTEQLFTNPGLISSDP
jgi:hypothetical protein